jgi:uncharacterized lipoprotein YmbA
MLNKIVNGQELVCSPEEEAQIRAEWAANESKANQPISKSLEEQIEELKAKVEALEGVN